MRTEAARYKTLGCISEVDYIADPGALMTISHRPDLSPFGFGTFDDGGPHQPAKHVDHIVDVLGGNH
jgi:hypothetical protein